jgi:TetR/AcrR family transcriptional repressor of bet genes
METSAPGAADEEQGRPGDAARRARRQRQLIDAALDCIGSLGLRDTTVSDVARRAGMAVGSISQYFASKEQLFTAALAELSDEFEGACREHVGRAGSDPANRLRAFVLTYFEPSICQRRKVAVWFAFWGEVKARPQYRAVCAGHDQRHDEALEALCRALLGEGRSPAGEPAAIATLIAAMCHGLWLELLTGTERLGRADLARLALAGLAAYFPQSRFADPAGG